jgi:hypothetical protein
MDDEQRKVARDAYMLWNGSRYSVPWQYAGKEVWVRDHGPAVEIHGSNPSSDRSINISQRDFKP